jgi:hypothetical protein
MRDYYVRESLKQRRWLKKSIAVRHAAIDREVARFKRRERGWIPVLDKEDGFVYAHHWLALKPVIHKGRKP